MPNPEEYLKRISVVVITGGSTGIGHAIIKSIIEIRPEIFICNLSRTKPENFSEKNRFHLTCDLSDKDVLENVSKKLLQIIKNEVEPGEILLINNSGFGDYARIQDADLDKLLNMIDLNIRAMVDLTGRLLPELMKQGGVVVNIASTAAFQPTAYMATYGASKVFVLNWTLALNEDLRGSGVRAIAICPGPTESNFYRAAGFEKAPLNAGLGMSAEAVARLTLSALAKGRVLVVTGWKNRVTTTLASIFPRLFTTRVAASILRKMRLEAHREQSDQ